MHKKQIDFLSTKQIIGFFLGIFLFLIVIFFTNLSPSNPKVTRMAASALLIAVWWITEALPIPVTSLLPLILFPLLGIMKGKAVSKVYMNHNIFLFIGGFFIALAMEKWNLHKRIALNILSFIGDRPRRLVLGFMIATAFLSMWISNTATTMMIMPIGLSIISQMERLNIDKKKVKKIGLVIMIATAYSASIGGIATLIGTPPNISFSRIFSITFPKAPEITFAKWFFTAFPISIVFLIITWVLLVFVLVKLDNQPIFGGSNIIEMEKKELGPFSFEEKVVFIIFILTALLWIFRNKIEIGHIVIPGWSELLGLSKFVDDGTIAIATSTILFMIPSKKKREFIMDWKTAVKIPWGVILLFGGGFALASGFKASGLSAWIGNLFKGFTVNSSFIITIITCTVITFLTEMTSNTATTEMILPILASVAVALKINPLTVMVPATISASCAFMLPVATPPNAIVYASGYIEMSQMAKFGIILNIVGIILVSGGIFLLGHIIIGGSPLSMPFWAVK